MHIDGAKGVEAQTHQAVYRLPPACHTDFYIYQQNGSRG
jgi:hypothetical protein